jgi:putative transposase
MKRSIGKSDKLLFMANTYTQIDFQFVFAVEYRQALIEASWKDRLHQYITGIFQHNQHKMLQINSMPDHIHVLIGLRPHQSISALIQNVKAETTKWLKQQNLSASFAWQESYGAFSYSKSQVPDVIRYIQNQEMHHRKQSFLEEYKSFLKAFEIDFDEQYIFKEPI